MEFSGEYFHSVDGKGRVIFPVKMRDGLRGLVALQKGIDRCINVYPPEEWERVVAKVRELPRTEPRARRFARHFFSQSTRDELDKQGRLTLPQQMREYAGLDKDVVIAGNGPLVEIWDRSRWERTRDETEGDLDDIARELGI